MAKGSEENREQQIPDELYGQLSALDEERRDLSMICQIAKSFSGREPDKVAAVLASTMADRLEAHRAVVLLADRVVAVPIDADAKTVPTVPTLLPAQSPNDEMRAFSAIYGINVEPDVLESIRYQPQQGILWQFARSGEPFPVVGFGGKPLYQSVMDEAGMGDLKLTYWVPLPNKDTEDLIGIVCLDTVAKSPAQTRFLSVLAALGARAIHNAMLFQELEESKIHLSRQMHKLRMLYDVGRALSVVDNRNYLLTKILQQAASIAKAEKGSIMLFDDASEKLVVQVVFGIGAELEQRILKGEIETTVLRRGEGIAGKVAQSGVPIVVNHVNQNPAGFVQADRSKVSSILCVPLKLHKDVIGVLNITNKKDGESFSDDDLQIIEQVADQAAVAIHNSRLYELAVTDGLTKVYIRRHLFQRLSEELKRATRYEWPTTILMIDIDHFKKINDTFGHPCGDRVLGEVARILKQSVRDSDLVGRYGGEEFCVVLTTTDIEGGRRVARRMHAMLEELDITWDGQPVRVAVSGGMANYPEHASSLTDLIRFADTALYYSKRHGRNKTTIYNENQLNMAHELDV